MSFGQLVIGPPGSGKTTYCNGMSQFLTQIGRKVIIINLDPANDVPYEVGIDLRELVDLSSVMDNVELGPNGGLVYCMDYLEKNLDWLKAKLALYKDYYFLFDCPGQAELYTHYTSLRNIVDQIQRWGTRLAAVHLVDSYYCSVPSTYISAVLLSLSTMLNLELPHINVLSKVDLIEKYGKLAFDLEFFADVGDLEYLLERLEEEPGTKKYAKLNRALGGLIEDFGLVSFVPLNIQDKESVYNLVKQIDKSNGYIYGSYIPGNESLFTVAEGPTGFNYDRIGAVQEKYMEDHDLQEEELWTDDDEEEEQVEALRRNRESVAKQQKKEEEEQVVTKVEELSLK